MRLVTVGDITINFDLAISLADHGSHLEVFFVATSADGQPTMIAFEGDHGEALRRWLQRNAENASLFEDGNTGEPLSERQPYTSPR